MLCKVLSVAAAVDSWTGWLPVLHVFTECSLVLSFQWFIRLMIGPLLFVICQRSHDQRFSLPTSARIPHRYVSGNSSVTHIWNTIGVSNGRHLSSYMCKVSQNFCCGRSKQRLTSSTLSELKLALLCKVSHSRANWRVCMFFVSGLSESLQTLIHVCLLCGCTLHLCSVNMHVILCLH